MRKLKTKNRNIYRNSINDILLGNPNNKFKNISRDEFRKRPDLIKKYGKFGNADGDYKNGKPVLNWNDCFPFDSTRHAWVTSTTGKAGSFTNFISSIGESVKATFSKPQTQTVTTSTGQTALVPAGTSNVPSGAKPSVNISPSSVGSSLPSKSGGPSGGGGSVSPMFGGSSTPSIFTPTTTTTPSSSVATNNLGLGSVNLGNVQTRATIENTGRKETLREQFNRERQQIAAGIPGVIQTFFPKKEPVIPTGLSYSQQLGYQKSGTINAGQQVQTADLWRLGYREEAGKQELGLFGLGQQGQLNKIAEQEAEKVSQELQNVGKSNIDFTYNVIQNKVNSGELSVKEAQKELDKYVTSENERLNKQFQDKFNTNMNPYIKESERVTGIKAEELNKRVNRIGKEYAVEKAIGAGIVGFGIGAVSTILPPVGLAFGAYSGVTQAAALPETISYAKQDPWGFGSSLAGGIVGGGLGALAGRQAVLSGNTAKVNDYLANKKITQKDIEVTNTITHSKAVNVGLDDLGNTIWKIKQTGLTKIINKKTGALIDKSISIADIKVVAKTAESAVKSVVDGTAISLRRSGWRLSQNGNQLNLKGQTSYLQGEAISYPTKVEGITYGRGEYDIFTGGFKGKVRDAGIKIKASIANKPQYSARSDFFNLILGKKVRVVKTGKGNVAGIETKSLTFAETDVSPNFYFTKKGIIKSYAKGFKKEQIPVRDYSLDKGTSFDPKAFQYGDLDFTPVGNNLKGNLQQVSKLSSQANAQLVAQQAQRAQMSAFALENTKAIIGGYKNAPAPKLVQPKVLPGFISSSLVESNYPMIVGGTKQKDLGYNFGMTGNVVNDYSTESVRVPSQTKTKVDTGIDYQSKYSYKPLSNLLNIQQPQIKTLTKTQTGIKTNINSIQNIFLGTSQISQQQYKLQTKQLQQQIQIPSFKIPPYNINMRIPTPKIPKPIIFPSYGGGYFYKPRKTKSKGKQKTKYQSSLGAFQLNIFTPKKMKVKKYKSSGIELRGMTRENEDYKRRLSKLINT